MVLRRVPQRQLDDCAICSIASILGYSYERVQADRRQRYGHVDDRTAWWEWYLEDEGHSSEYLPTTELEIISRKGDNVAGLFVVHHHALGTSHIVTIDQLGFVDPSDGFPDHVLFDVYPTIKTAQGVVFDQEILAVALSTAEDLNREDHP